MFPVYHTKASRVYSCSASFFPHLTVYWKLYPVIHEKTFSPLLTTPPYLAVAGEGRAKQ